MTAGSEIVIDWRNAKTPYEQETDWVIEHVDSSTAAEPMSALLRLSSVKCQFGFSSVQRKLRV